VTLIVYARSGAAYFFLIVGYIIKLEAILLITIMNNIGEVPLPVTY